MKAARTRRAQKVKTRRKVNVVRRRKIFIVVQVAVLGAALLGAARLGANRLSQFSFLPVAAVVRSQMVISRAQASPDSDDALYYQERLRDTIDESWSGKSRFWCVWDMSRMHAQLLERYPAIKRVDWDWLGLLLRGKINLRFEVRHALAKIDEEPFLPKIARLQGACLDDDGQAFPCPRLGHASKPLLKVQGYNRDSIRIGLKAAPGISTLLKGSLITGFSFSADVIIFADDRGRLYHIAGRDVASKDRRNAVLEKLTAVIIDLDSRGEDYAYVNMTLAGSDKVFVGRRESGAKERTHGQTKSDLRP